MKIRLLQLLFLLMVVGGFAGVKMAHPLLGGIWAARLGNERTRMGQLHDAVLADIKIPSSSALVRIEPTTYGISESGDFPDISYAVRKQTHDTIELVGVWQDTELIRCSTGRNGVEYADNMLHPGWREKSERIKLAGNMAMGGIFAGAILLLGSLFIKRQ